MSCGPNYFVPKFSTALGWTRLRPSVTLMAPFGRVSAQRRHPSGNLRQSMATVTLLPSGSQPEHRGLSFWMDRVIRELENVRLSPEADAVHDLRVAIRRCRSVAA